MNVKWIKPEIVHGKPTKYGWVVLYPENLVLGNMVDIGFGTLIQAEKGVEIKDNVQIGAHCAIYSKNTIDNTSGKIIIEKGAKIGAGTVILPKNKDTLIVGKNSKVGALSLVKQNIPENEVWVGNPAKYKWSQK